MDKDPTTTPSANLNNKEIEATSPLIRLLPHTVNSLPIHPALAPTISAQNNGEAPQDPDRLLNFAQNLLAEAIAFTDDYLPREFTSKSTKSSPGSSAKVELLEHTRNKSGNEETWFARRSRHVDQAESGTATFAELDAGLRHEHSLHELQYTPDVFDAHEVLSWDSELAGLLAPSSSTSAASPPATITASDPATRFTDISMRVYEMCHSLPTPLQPRVFSVLVAAAKTIPIQKPPTATEMNALPPTPKEDAAADGFIVVQLPLDIKSVPAAFYSNGRNLKEGTAPEKRKQPVIGIYTSIERGRYSPHQHHGDDASEGQGHSGEQPGGVQRGETEWLMATASDARGVLPMWMQKMGTPAAVVKDVGLFMKWVQEKREQ